MGPKRCSGDTLDCSGVLGWDIGCYYLCGFPDFCFQPNWKYDPSMCQRSGHSRRHYQIDCYLTRSIPIRRIHIRPSRPLLWCPPKRLDNLYDNLANYNSYTRRYLSLTLWTLHIPHRSPTRMVHPLPFRPHVRSSSCSSSSIFKYRITDGTNDQFICRFNV